MIAMRCAALALTACTLSACSENDVKEVNDWMAQVRKETRVAVPPLAEPKTFIPFAYTAQEATDPFSADKLLAELAKAANSNNNRFKPDMERRKEPLESFPLDTFVMVGVLQKAGLVQALLQVDKAVYQVKTGQRMGQNYGLVTGVTENAVTIKEVVQDAGGEWVERTSKLELQESKETKK